MEALKYFEKSLAVVATNDDPELVSRAEAMISMARANMNMGKDGYDNFHKEAEYAHKERYIFESKKCESSVDAVQFGVSYAEFMKRSQHRGC